MRKLPAISLFYSVICNYIRKTLVAELNDHARDPVEVIVIMEEAQRKKVTFDINVTDNRKLLTEQIGRVIGFPSDEKLQSALNKYCKDLYAERESINALKDEALRTERRLGVSITDEMVELLIKELNSLSEGSAFEFKCASYEVFNEAMDNLFRRGNDVWEITKAVRASDKSVDKRTESTCTYSYDNKILTVRIYFKTND